MAYVVVFITCPDMESAEKIAKTLVEKKLAACVNLVKVAKSIYRWKGKVEEAEEVLLIAKTKTSLVEQLKKEVKSVHPYQVPEVICTPVIAGLEEYLKWLEQETLG